MKEEDKAEYSKLSTIGEEVYQPMCLSRKKTEGRKRLDETLTETGIFENYKDFKIYI